jgi:pimeloyl-ACP methyl ester carboxylesterase
VPELTTGDGVRLHYTDAGGGPPLVCLPGWSMSGRWFDLQVDAFAGSRRVVVLDPRAQGRSEPVERGHRLGRHAADLHDLLTALDLRDVAVLAWSRGTSVLMAYWEIFGADRVRAVALSGFNASLTARPDWPWGFNNPPAQFVLEVERDVDGVLRAMMAEMVLVRLDPELTSTLVESSLATPARAAARMLADHFAVDWRDLLPTLTVPVLVCAGRQDAAAPLAAAQAAVDLLPDAELAVFERSGHCPFVEEPAAFNARLAAFLDRVG